MQVFDSLTRATLHGPTHLTIGNFDGFHRGHRALIERMQADARTEGAATGLLTFHPHPRTVLRPGLKVTSLTSLTERLALYTQAGLDFTVIHPFTQATAQTEPDDFLRLLHEHLGVTKLWVGPDFALGRNRKGDIPFLRHSGRTLGIEIDHDWAVVLIGAGDLGHALAHYQRFATSGFDIVGVFDNDPEKIDGPLGRFTVRDIADRSRCAIWR